MNINDFKLFKLGKIMDVPIYSHWSLNLIVIIIAINNIENIPAILGLISFYGVLLLHEMGHAYFAKKLRYDVDRIRLYPIFGFCDSEFPDYEYDLGIISLGGVLFQAILFIPFTILSILLKDINNDYLKLELFVLGPLNLSIAMFNMMPIAFLDGKYAWKGFPYIYSRLKSKYKF